MSYDNVQLWFAKDENEKIITINEVNKNNNHKYYCPLCGSDLIPRQGDIMSWHFAHVDKSKCSGESMYHFWIKNKLLEKGDKFIIESDIKREYICKDIFVEKEYIVNGKIYRPDLTVLTESGDTIYFEMDYSNTKKLEDYLNTWIELNNIVVEVNVKTLLKIKNNKLPIFKAKYYEGKCFNLKKEDNIYHNTIGQYKELLKQTNKYNKKKKDIGKLDWFWKSIHDYKIQKVNFNDIALIIDSITNEKERKIITMILKSTSCHSIIDDYINYQKLVVKNLFNTLKNGEYLSFEIFKPHKIYDRLFNLEIYIKYKNSDYIKLFKKDFSKKTILRILNKMEIEIKERKKDIEFRNKIFNKIEQYIKNTFDYNNICNNIYLTDEPNSNLYINHHKYTDYNLRNEYRLYLNNFPKAKYSEYITRRDCNNENEICDFIKRKASYNTWEFFSKKDILLIDRIAKQIYDKYNKDNFKIEISVCKRKYIDIDIYYKDCYYENIMIFKDYGFYSINLYKRLYLLIGLIINKKIIKEKKENKINYICNTIRKKYDPNNNIKQRNITSQNMYILTEEYLKSNIKLLDETFIKKITNEYISIISQKKCKELLKIVFQKKINEQNNIFNKNIKLFYKKAKPRNKRYTNLKNFDFVTVVEKISKINDYNENSRTLFGDEFDNIVSNLSYNIDDDDLTKKLENVLLKQKDIFKLFNTFFKTIKKIQGDVHILLDIKYTKSNNGYRPWLINDFINELNKIGFNNITNIKTKEEWRD